MIHNELRTMVYIDDPLRGSYYASHEIIDHLRRSLCFVSRGHTLFATPILGIYFIFCRVDRP